VPGIGIASGNVSNGPPMVSEAAKVVHGDPDGTAGCRVRLPVYLVKLFGDGCTPSQAKPLAVTDWTNVV
jgi:hypothetical protein